MAKVKDLGGNCTADRYIPSYIVSNRFDEFFGLLMNAIKVKNVTFIEEQFIKRQLLLSNVVGYDGITKRYYSILPDNDKNEYGLPQYGVFKIIETSKEFKRKLSYEPTISGAYYITGLPSQITYSDIIKQHTDIIEQCDIAIRQNLEACQTPAFIVVENKDQRLAVEHAIQQKQIGMPAIVVGVGVAEAMRGVTLNTPIIFDQIYEFKQKIVDSLLNKIAVMTANVDKKERVQSAEVNATVGQCEDYIYMLIDNVNRQCESYGLQMRLEINSSLEELYTPEDTEIKEEEIDEYV